MLSSVRPPHIYFFAFSPYVNDLFQQRVHLWYPKSLLTYIKPSTMRVQRKISYQNPYYSSPENDEVIPIWFLGWFLQHMDTIWESSVTIFASSCCFCKQYVLSSLPLTTYDQI